VKQGPSGKVKSEKKKKNKRKAANQLSIIETKKVNAKIKTNKIIASYARINNRKKSKRK